MLTIDIPGYKRFDLEHLVLDYNGTLACDGKPKDGIRQRMELLSESLKIHVLTADSFGSVNRELRGYPCEIFVLPKDDQGSGKFEYIEKLGLQSTVSIGNGRNDHLMIKGADLGIVVCQEEGIATHTLLSSDIVCPDILTALDLLLHPLRLISALRT
jgi:soluble P-type ATPase